VRPETILAWFRQLEADKCDSSETRKVGRPRKASDIRQLVLDIARDNRGWGYTKIRDALRGLKIEIGRTTVASIPTDAGVEPAPERNRKRTWAHFLAARALRGAIVVLDLVEPGCGGRARATPRACGTRWR